MVELDDYAGGKKGMNGKILVEGVQRLAAEGEIQYVGTHVQRAPQADLVKWAQDADSPIVAEGADIYIVPFPPIYQ